MTAKCFEMTLSLFIRDIKPSFSTWSALPLSNIADGANAIDDLSTIIIYFIFVS